MAVSIAVLTVLKLVWRLDKRERCRDIPKIRVDLGIFGIAVGEVSRAFHGRG
jgi:hypothetical protein